MCDAINEKNGGLETIQRCAMWVFKVWAIFLFIGYIKSGIEFKGGLADYSLSRLPNKFFFFLEKSLSEL